jgi:O-antigen ligase
VALEVLLSFAAFFLTYTRSAWIGLAVVMVLLAVIQYRRLIPLTVLAALTLVVAVPSTVDQVERRFGDLSSTSPQYSANSWQWRLDHWDHMKAYAASEPYVGHGLASFRPLTFQEYGSENNQFPIDGPDDGIYPHNDFLGMAVELGYIGAALWIMVLLGLMALTWRARRVPELKPWASGAFALICGVALISAVDNIQLNTGMMFYVLALAGAVVGAMRRYPMTVRTAAGSPYADADERSFTPPPEGTNGRPKLVPRSLVIPRGRD